YPKADRLKHFIALALQQHVFMAGNEAEEIRALWRAAHQKVLLDESWLQELLSQQALALMDVAVEQTRDPDAISTTSAGGEPRVDWGDALDVPTFYGREEELALLSRWVGEQRCRVVSVLGMGGMRAGFEGYAQLLRRIGETAHQSCLLLASREKPAELVSLEGNRSPVRTLRLAGLDGRAGVQLLAEKDVVGSSQDQARLVEVYRGNPLALKIVAQTIVELYGGEIVLFLEQGEVVFGGVRELLREQFDRLSALEQSVF